MGGDPRMSFHHGYYNWVRLVCAINRNARSGTGTSKPSTIPTQNGDIMPVDQADPVMRAVQCMDRTLLPPSVNLMHTHT